MIILLLFCTLVGSSCFVESTKLSRNLNKIPCSKPGYNCQTCEDVSYCIELHGGNWLEEYMYSCQPGTTCLQSSGSCTSLPNPSCDPGIEDYTFKCRQVGIFPDPLNCFEYHICRNFENSTEVDEVSLKMFCEAGYYYDPSTTLCRLKAVNNTCPAVAPPCAYPGQSGALQPISSLYYICLPSPVKIFPQMFACPYDKQYDGAVCAGVPLPPPAAGDDGKCLDSGLFYDPDNCSSYYGCEVPGSTPILYECDYSMHFNYTTSSCEYIKCADLA